MPDSDVSSAVLASVASASASAYDKAITHVAQEIAARDPQNLDALVATLADDGPYAYTILPRVGEDGSVTLPVLTTREEITEAYAFIRGLSDLHEVIGLTEVRSSWYLFQNNMTRGGAKGSDVLNSRETLSLFPSGAGSGITGELVWLRVPRDQLGVPQDNDGLPAEPLLARRAVYDQHVTYLEAMRTGDVDAVLSVLHPGAASAIRDYVTDSGTLVELTGRDEHRAWYSALFARYEVQEIQPLYTVTQDWYVFAELRLTVIERNSGAQATFHTAEFHVTGRDGRFMARIGHGTTQA